MHDAKSFFVDTFKYDFKEKPIFWTYPLFFKRHQWFQIGLWTENKLTFQKPRFCYEIFFFPLLFFIYIDQNTWAQSSSTHTCIWKSESKEWTEDSRNSNYFYSKEADSFDRCNVTVSEKCYICLTILNGFLH